MNITIINGSSRPESQSEKVSTFIAKRLNAQTHMVHVHDVFPTLWDHESFHELPESLRKKHLTLLKTLESSDAFVVVVPEWGGMVPPALKNLFLTCGQELAHKPALIVSVSSGTGGSYPISELRMSSYKNTKICYLPEHVIIRDVTHVLNSDLPADENDERIRTRLAHALTLLEVYSAAFQSIRATPQLNLHAFPYGM